MNIYCDSSVDEACVVTEFHEPTINIIPYEKRVTNNVGEYRAALLAATAAWNLRSEDVTIYTDSLLVVNQTIGVWRCRKKLLEPLMLQLRRTLEDLAIFKGRKLSDLLQWIPREESLAGRVLDGG
jgi:ribonuclease HI